MTSITGVGTNDLDGVYFSTPDYTFTSAGNNYTITATGNSGGSTAPQKSQVAGIVVTLDKSGNFVINAQFDEAMPFADGLARVKMSGRTGYVGTDGKFVWNPTK